MEVWKSHRITPLLELFLTNIDNNTSFGLMSNHSLPWILENIGEPFYVWHKIKQKVFMLSSLKFEKKKKKWLKKFGKKKSDRHGSLSFLLSPTPFFLVDTILQIPVSSNIS